jgi:taurine dioxygenase
MRGSKYNDRQVGLQTSGRDNTTTPAGYQVAPLGADVAFGAMVLGLTLEKLGDQSVRKALYDLWIDRGVLLFRGDSSAEMHVELSKCFGTLERHPFPESWVEGRCELVKIKYYPDNGTVYEVDGELRGGWLPWHADLFYTDKINHGGILMPVQLPQNSGKTGFIDRIAAYDRLPQDLKVKIEGLHAVYAMDINAEHMRYARPKSLRLVRGANSFRNIMLREYQYPRILHPMVYQQAETGRKVLNISPQFALGIYEIGGPEGEALMRELVDCCVNEANTYFHEWRMDDMLLWDNWRSLHCFTGVPADQTRVMHRTTISGNYALGRKLEEAPRELERVDY